MTRGQKRDLIKIFISLSLMVFGILTENLFPTEKLPLVTVAGTEINLGIAAIYVTAYLTAGFETLGKALNGILRGQMLDENFLMTIASIGALLLQDYKEGVAVMLFYNVGELFEDYAVNKSRKSIKDLMDIRPDYANLYNEQTGEVMEVDPYEVKVGDRIQIKPGERVPLDAKILKGNSSVQTAALTGESVPRDLGEGDTILSGFINMTGVLLAEVQKDFEESTASKILELVEQAADSKAGTERFITKFARIYTPCVVFAAAALAIIPSVLFGEPFGTWSYRAMVFLVISCPCALVISVPLSFFGGIGAASKAGILVKGSNFLEVMSQVDTVVFDKTGTLTTGEFKVTEVIPAKSGTGTAMEDGEQLFRDEIINLAAHAECFSPHPIAASIRAAYGKEIPQEKLREVEDIAGYGIRAKVISDSDTLRMAERQVLVGNLRFMRQQTDLISKAAEEATAEAEKSGVTGTLVYVAVDGKYRGLIVIGDELKRDTAYAINGLLGMGIDNIVMLTGDRRKNAEKLAGLVGIKAENVYAELLPADKLSKVEEIIERGKINKANHALVYVGDGLNDAPVLARADVGIAMGSLGSDAAIDAADAVIMTDEPSKLLTLFAISKKTLGIAKENIAFALIIKFLVLALGAVGLAGMWAAVFC